MQLHPRQTFTITRQLQNPYITDTFYVRAVIRNAKTDAIITTLDLEDQTGQRFTKDWMVSTDPTGLGFYISIVTSVYDDSGYTTKSQNYGDEETTYLVQDRYVWNPNYPVGADIDYKRIRKIVLEVVKGLLDDIESPEPKVVTVTNVREVVKEVRVPEIRVVETQKSQDLSSILKAIDTVGKKIDDKPVTEVPEFPEQKETDLKPVLDAVSKLDKKLDTLEVEVNVNAPTKMEARAVKSPIQDPRITKLIKR